MSKRWFLTVLSALLLLAWGRQSGAAEVVILKSTNAVGWRPVLQTLRSEGSAHTFTEEDLGGDAATAQRVVAGLKGRSVIAVALGPLAAQACREGAPEVPLIFAMVPDPAKVGLLNAPNVTGVAYSIPVKNQLAAFRMVNPRAVRIGVIHGPDSEDQVRAAERSANVVRLVIVERAIASERDVPEALRALLKDVDALWIPPDPLLLGEQTRHFVMSETLRRGKPIYSFSSALVSEGALVSDGPDMASIGRQLAELVARVAGGERPGAAGMRVPRADLVINKKIADKLKIEIPADALKAASKIF